MTNKLTSLRALVIDDDPEVLDWIGLLLADMGLSSVITEHDGNAAIQRVRAQPDQLDVILCDLNMPDMDGVELLRHLADSTYTGAVGIISGADSRIMSAAERLASSHNIFFLGYLEKSRLSVDVLSRLLERSFVPRAATLSAPERQFQKQEIHQAINTSEMEVFYQPQTRLDTGQLVGVEALVRWQHPQHGLIQPQHFIEASERYQLIDPLTLCVLDQAARHLASWHQQGYRLNLAINLSAQTLHGLGFPNHLLALLQELQIDPRYITLEITESQALEALPAPMETLTRLRLNGFKLSIDDFGTGYSSLEQLNRLPFTELKIDRSFVQSAPDDAASRIIMETSVNMAKRLGMKVVAEGVENATMLKLVQQLGCDEVQGFYIAKPMSATAFEDYLATHAEAGPEPSA